MKKNKASFFKIAFALVFLIVLIFWLSLQKSSGKGEVVYKENCMSCHGESGQGLKKLIPPIAHSDYWMNNKSKLPCIIRNGMKDSIIVNGRIYYQLMPSNNKLNEIDLANLINYINKKWYNDDSFVNQEEVKEMLEHCE